MDDIKVNVKKDEAKPTDVKKQPAAKKAVKKSSSGLIKFILSIIVTALIVGGGVYAWESNVAQTGLDKLAQEARTTRASLESEMASLKSELNNQKTQNANLQETQNSLEEKAKLLATAQKEFSNSTLGLSFVYPAIFGDINFSITNASSGQMFIGEFSDNNSLTFGGIANNFNSTSSPSILQTQGYLKKGDKYYFENIGVKATTDYEIKPIKSINVGGNDILLIDNNSFVKPTASSTPVFKLGTNGLAAIADLKTKGFAGVAFWDKDITVIKQADFEKMLSTIIIK